MLHEAVLVRGPRPYTGSVEPGDVFAWEPDLPHARMLCVVMEVKNNGEEDWVRTRPLEKNMPGSLAEPCWNSMDRFREAVVPTLFKKMPVE
jgi:hypothetical protein